ncbi:MAG TPA: bifunctional alpha,alpha-trehalose-phosphate synthase (UDP-forming)/trehalose-phosphatase [Polyangia bacterium]
MNRQTATADVTFVGPAPAPSRLLIASNRLPVTICTADGQPRLLGSTGGLASALKAPHQSANSQWFGWPGDLDALGEASRAVITSQLEALRAVPLSLSAAEVERYYDGFSNGVLWPLLHYLLDKVDLDAERDWTAFQAVNQRFAAAIAERYRRGDRIWVHDYQLALVPGLLRQLLPDATIGFFLHVPFPAVDVFRILPWGRQILRGLLGADLVGFHTPTYAENFRESAALLLAAEADGSDLNFEGRRIRTGAFPIGIDAAAFASTSTTAEVADRITQIRAAAGGKHIVLGIDRLDYTKGVPRRLLAIDRLLNQRPDLRDKLHFIQIAVPTRERVDAYADLRRTVNELVGRINSQHGTSTGAPVHLLYRSVNSTELVALYRAADVMLVTPLRDGMNLVAKEFVAARTDGAGVLVLSEFAGAAAELPEALLVNPYDLGATARALEIALDMPREEQASRMEAMQTTVKSNDVNHWAENFLTTLGACLHPPAFGESATARDLRTGAHTTTLPQALSLVRVAERRTLVLDYDGTLVGFAPTPDQAVPDDELRWLLAALASLPGTDVHIVSGRDRDSLERWLGDLRIGLHAEHGFWSRTNGEWLANEPITGGWQGPVQTILEAVAANTPGALVERKTTSVAFHYRRADPALASQRVREIRRMLGPFVASDPIELLSGSCVLEVRPRGVHKGLVVGRIAKLATAQNAVVLAAGDDLTDEDGFRALPPGSISIKVGVGPSLADCQVGSPHELRRHLWTLIQ